MVVKEDHQPTELRESLVREQDELARLRSAYSSACAAAVAGKKGAAARDRRGQTLHIKLHGRRLQCPTTAEY